MYVVCRVLRKDLIGPQAVGACTYLSESVFFMDLIGWRCVPVQNHGTDCAQGGFSWVTNSVTQFRSGNQIPEKIQDWGCLDLGIAIAEVR